MILREVRSLLLELYRQEQCNVEYDMILAREGCACCMAAYDNDTLFHADWCDKHEQRWKMLEILRKLEERND